MSAKKVKKTNISKRKVVRKTPNINLLKNINVLFLIFGFLFALVTIGLLSSRSENYDLRSRGQALPSSAPSIPAGIPSAVCLGGECVMNPDNNNEQEQIPDQGRGTINNPNRQPGQDAPEEVDANPDPEPDADNPDNPDEGDANKGHGNDADGVDEDNPGQGLGGPNAEKNNEDNNGGFMEVIQQFFAQLLQLFGGGQNQQ